MRTGRFLQTDPVPGGSANDYDYCNADPINCTDLNGQWGWEKFFGVVAKVAVTAAGAAALFSCFVCVGLGYAVAAYGGYGMGRNLVRRHYRAAGWDALGLVSFSVGRRVQSGLKSARAGSRYWRTAASSLRKKRGGSTCRRHLRRAQAYERQAARYVRHERAAQYADYGHWVGSTAYNWR